MEEDILIEEEISHGVGSNKAESNNIEESTESEILEINPSNSEGINKDPKSPVVNINTKNKDSNLDSSESILSTINEHCSQIESKDKENGIKSDSECSSDFIEREGIKESNRFNKKNSNTSDVSNSINCEEGSNSANNGVELQLDNSQSSFTDSKIINSDNAKLVDEDSQNKLVINDEDKQNLKKEDYFENEVVEKSQEKTDSLQRVKENFNVNEKNDSSDAEKSESSSEKTDSGKVKIKLRSFASLCESDIEKKDDSSCNSFDSKTNSQFEVSGVAVGDIVQHSNFVESDESGVMHLKISNVVGGEDCITGISVDEGSDSLLPLQISSISSLIEPLSPEEDRSGNADAQTTESDKGDKIATSGSSLSNDNDMIEDANAVIINIFKSPLVVAHACIQCHKKLVCDFRMVTRENSENKITFMCSSRCKSKIIANLSERQLSVQKPKQYFERVCGTCGKELNCSSSDILGWQTREFCNKLCLADHIGEVARSCFYCQANVRVLYMVKYCVRFGSEVHQFCCNTCLENYKATIKVCSFCQKNLTHVTKVISPSNKEYCSNKCLKRAQRRDIGQINYKEENVCTVCNKKLVNKYEFLNSGATTFLCSNPCFNVYKYVNQVKSVNCCLCARLLNAEDSSNYFYNGKQLRVFCSASCFSVFVISARKIVVCHYCKVKKYNFDMICAMSEDKEEYFCCSVCCLNLTHSKNNSKDLTVDGTISENVDSKQLTPNSSTALPPTSVTPTTSTAVGKSESSPTTTATTTTPTTKTENSTAQVTPLLKNCNMCSKLEPAQFHMVMSDSTLRSFCSYICATSYKGTFGFHVSGGLSFTEKKKETSNDISRKTKNTTSSDVQTSTTPTTLLGSKSHQKMDMKDAKSLMRLFCPPHLSNKSTSCKPIQNTKAIQCRPHQWHKTTQTDGEAAKPIIPVPIPVYVPTPMMMYSAPTPVPLIVPVPVPIPIFIPTSKKTTKELEEKIKSTLAGEVSEPEETGGDFGEVRDEDEGEVVEDVKDDPIRGDVENESIGGEVEDESVGGEVEDDSLGVELEDNTGGGEVEVAVEESRGVKRVLEEETGAEGILDTKNVSATTELEVVLRLEESLHKHLVNSEKVTEESTDTNSEGQKRKHDSSTEETSSKRRRVHDDDEDEGPNEVLDLVVGLSVWDTWVQRKLMEDSEASNGGLQEDISAMTSEELNKHLISFLKDLAFYSSQYEVDTIFYILLGLQKYLFEKGSTHCIFLEINFDEFTTVFEGMVDKFFTAAAKPGTKCLEGTRVTEEMLWEARQLGAHTPHVLINTLFYFNTKIFKLKRSIDHFNLTFDQVAKEGKKTGNTPEGMPILAMYLRYKKDPKLQEEGDTSTPELMIESKDNPLRCPVKLYEFYTSKCPLSIRAAKNTYYVYPEVNCLPDSPVWYSTRSIDVETIEKMLNRILLVREVQESLFGH